MAITEGVTKNGVYLYSVLNEILFLEFIDALEGRYYDDQIRSAEDLKNSCNDLIRKQFNQR